MHFPSGRTLINHVINLSLSLSSFINGRVSLVIRRYPINHEHMDDFLTEPWFIVLLGSVLALMMLSFGAMVFVKRKHMLMKQGALGSIRGKFVWAGRKKPQLLISSTHTQGYAKRMNNNNVYISMHNGSQCVINSQVYFHLNDADSGYFFMLLFVLCFFFALFSRSLCVCLLRNCTMLFRLSTIQKHS